METQIWKRKLKAYRPNDSSISSDDVESFFPSFFRRIFVEEYVISIDKYKMILYLYINNIIQVKRPTVNLSNRILRVWVSEICGSNKLLLIVTDYRNDYVGNKIE